MDNTFKEISERGITSDTFSDYLNLASSSLDEAFLAAENNTEISSAVKVGQSKAYLDAAKALWYLLNSK